MTLRIQKTTGAKLRFHQPNYGQPFNPLAPITNGSRWTDPETGTDWRFDDTTQTWVLV